MSIQGDADQNDALAATLRSVRRMAGLVANFVDIARFEDAAVKPKVRARACGRAAVGDRRQRADGEAGRDARDRLRRPSSKAGSTQASSSACSTTCSATRLRYCKPGRQDRCSAHGVGSTSRTAASRSSVANTGPQVPENIRAEPVRQVRSGQGRQARHGPLFLPARAEATVADRVQRGRTVECELRTRHVVGT